MNQMQKKRIRYQNPQKSIIPRKKQPLKRIRVKNLLRYLNNQCSRPRMLTQNRKKRRQKNQNVLVVKQDPGHNPMSLPKRREDTVRGGDISFTSKQWLDLLKWAHHTDALSRNQRQKIVMMGRLIQKDGKLTKRQQEQIREILSFVYALGYHS